MILPLSASSFPMESSSAVALFYTFSPHLHICIWDGIEEPPLSSHATVLWRALVRARRQGLSGSAAPWGCPQARLVGSSASQADTANPPRCQGQLSDSAASTGQI